MNESILDKIIRETGREPVNCSCHKCQNQCRRAPCLGTPADILRLIDAGYADKLAPTEWATGLFIGKLNHTIKMIQVKKFNHGCAFFENGLCQLHDLNLKPTEGRLSHHTIMQENFDFDKSLTWQVAKTWESDESKRDVLKVFLRYMEAMQLPIGGLVISIKLKRGI